VIGEFRIDERFLTIESLRCATTRETTSVKVSLNHFGEEFGNCAQPKPAPPVPDWGWSGLICSTRSFRAPNRTTVQCSTAVDVLAEALSVSDATLLSVLMVEDTPGSEISNYRDRFSSTASVHDKERKWRFVFHYSVSTRTSPNSRKS
jgi:hypothetical protein